MESIESRQRELQEKLKELKQYEEEQKNQLELAQKSVLTKEQLQMYEILGISMSSFMEIAGSNQNDFEEMIRSNSECGSEKLEEYDDPIDDSDVEEELNKSPTDYNNELIKNDDIKLAQQKFSVEEYKEDAGDSQVVKKPFLRRGAGLSSRFKMAPDAFSLKKLPPYKYTDRLKNTLARQKNAKSKDHEPQKRERTYRNSAPPVPENKTAANKCDEKVSKKKTERKSVPESTDLYVPKNVNLKIPQQDVAKEPITNQLLERITSKSIPEDLSETPKNPKLPKGVSWAQVLSSNNIADCSININELIGPLDGNDQDETSLFQLLEAKISNMNLDSSPASLIKLLSSLQSEQSNSSENKEIVQPDDPIIDEDANTINLKIQPHPNDINKKIIIDSEDDDSEDEDETVMQEYRQQEEDDHRVRFAENVEFVNNDDANSTILSSDLDAMELSQTSTPNERLKFQEFKRKMLGTNVNHAHMEQQADDLRDKSDMLKVKLQEIEKEKANIIRIRTELELDKIQLENDRDDMIEKFKDEKIKIEMQLHDERLKIEQQKQKMDKILKDAKNPTKKEREEVGKLKETVEELKEELKSKEARHGSAQARYRSQIKLLEKENQTLKLELEAAKKDNKKLDLENARLKRDTNSKMLQEINKNIAKLTQSDLQPKKPDTKKTVEQVRRKSEPVSKVTTKKQVPAKKAPVYQSSETTSESEEDENRDIDGFNPIRTKCSDPIRKSEPVKSISSSSDILSDMKREIVNSDGSKDIWYPNGNLKKITADGMLIRMLFYNKDIKETNINEGTVKYYYADNNTWHTTYIDGLEILEYPNGQVEHRYKDDTIEVHFPDGTIRITNKNWTNDVKEEWKMIDGTSAKIYKNDTKVVSFPNGQREIHTLNHKRREYPDGTVKIVYDDGVTETRYSCGRIRVKDKDGNLVSDNNTNK